MQYNIYVRVLILISCIFVIFGIGCAILAIKLHWRSLYLFFAALFLQTGIFLALLGMQIIHVGALPLLSVFTGIALFIAGWHRFRALKVNYTVLSAAFVLLGAIMMVFALDLIAFSLAQFVRDWWALLLLITGLILVLISLSARYIRAKKKANLKKNEA